MRVIGVIPARYDSSRFPGKVLARLDGLPLVEHLYRRALRARGISRVVVATDDRRVVQAVASFGGEAEFFTGDFRCGSDRVARLAAGIDGDVFLNIQADEPLMPPEAMEAAIGAFTDDSVLMTTVVAPINDEREWADPNIVKTVLDFNGDALYFSRAAVPFSKRLAGGRPERTAFKHLGIYGFRREFLLAYAALAPGVLEQTEELEQLRVLEHGYRIRVAITSHDSICVDTPEDLERLAAKYREGK